jgi:hypothetical protein
LGYFALEQEELENNPEDNDIEVCHDVPHPKNWKYHSDLEMLRFMQNLATSIDLYTPTR